MDDAPSQRFLRPADFSYHRHRPSFPNDNDDDDDDGHIRDAEDSRSRLSVFGTRRSIYIYISLFSPFLAMLRTYDETDRVNETVSPSFSSYLTSRPRLSIPAGLAHTLVLAWASLSRRIARRRFDRYSQLARGQLPVARPDDQNEVIR